MTGTHDAGIKSGMIFGGVLRVYTADKADFVDITFTSAVVSPATSAVVTFTNKAGGDNTVTLT